jgi:ATPase family associated with various cellular activities (AAA)
VRLEALEVAFEVRCEGSGARDLADSVRAAWDWCLPPGDNDGGPFQQVNVELDRDLETPARASGASSLSGHDLPTLMDRLSPLVTRLAVTERRHDLVMFHACAVADPDTGDTVVLYGPSGTGKTTLARTLCTDLVYLSDETAGVAADLRVVPYFKPLSIIVKPGDRLKEQVSPGQLGLVRPGEATFRLRGLVQLCREPEHRGEALVEAIATVDALPELMAQTSFTREMERPLHRMADLAHRVGGVRRATYAEAEQLRPAVRAILDGDV